LSAGLTRTVVNEEVLRALIEIGLDGSRQWSKILPEVADEPVDVVVTLAAEATQPARDTFPDAIHLDWSLPDPIAAANVAQVAQAVRHTRDEIHRRLRDWFQEENPHA
jgi:arsenate reductase